MPEPGYVLIVDDNPDVRHLISDVLAAMGVKGREAENGTKALEMAREEKPALIILDLMMPVMDGFTMLARLRSRPEDHDIPVILLSAIASDAPNMHKLPGVIGVLRKGDLSLLELSALVAKTLGVEDLALGKEEEDKPE
jgi:CheY-like chemotaxis protein